MDFSTVNIIAVLVCGAASIVIGAFWFSPFLFGKLWQKLVGISDEEIRNSFMPMVFVANFMLAALMALALSLFFGGKVGFTDGMLYGFFTGLFFVSTALGIMYIYERKPFLLWFINAGYNTLLFTAIGGILGSWQ